MAPHTDRVPISLIDEIKESVSIEDEPIDYYEEPTDRHVICIILTPDLKYVAWVFNFPYPAGKPAGWGIIGGRSESRRESVIKTALREIWEESGIKNVVVLEVVSQGWVMDRRRETEYLRTILVCVARDPGDPNTQALAEDGIPQTREFRWFPLDKPPSIQELGENVYFKHTNTITHPEVIRIIEDLPYSKHWPKIQNAKEEWDFNCVMR